MPENIGFEEAALRTILSQLDGMTDAAASTMGLPPGGKTYTQADIDKEWSYSPIADPAQRAMTMQQLKASGMTNSQITDMVYPNRRRVITTSRPRPEQQIAFAKQQDRRMEKLAAEQGMQMPNPDQPAGAPGQGVGPSMAAPAPGPLPPASPPLPDPGPVPPAQAPAPQQPAGIPSDSRGMLDMPAVMPSMIGG